MGLYLGSERMSPAMLSRPKNVKKFISGKATTDEVGILTLPKPTFEPSVIVVWNITQIDWTEQEDWEEGLLEYTHDGVLLVAIRQDGRWISQGTFANSGGVFITNASWTGGVGGMEPYSSSGITEGETFYSYQLSRHLHDDGLKEDTIYDQSDVEFNFIMYE